MGSHNIELGRLGEDLAVEYLRKERFEILARNFRTAHCELDIIAKDAFTLRIVEVKTRRNNLDTLSYSITAKKLASLKRAAISFLSNHHDLNRLEIYFDLITVVLDSNGAPKLEYIPDFVRY